MRRSKKPYVHATMKNEALLGAYFKWGTMTPSPNEIVGKKTVRNGATKSDNKLVASCRFHSSKVVAFCRSKLSLLVAYAA